MNIEEFNYHLPPNLIAQFPKEDRSDSRLLLLNPSQNKIDDKAVWVLNPGLLVGLDSRKDTNTPGFSLLGKGGYLQDCANETVYLVGGGGRYRAFIRERVSLDANLYVFMADAYEAWGDGENRVSKTLPVANLGINYHLKNNKTIGTTVTYIPEDTAIAATSGTDLLFFTANIAF